LIGFKNVIISFIGIIVLFLVRLDMIYFLRWERIGVISFLLIGFWVRAEATRSAIAAVMYNRLGDVRLICLLCIIDRDIL